MPLRHPIAGCDDTSVGERLFSQPAWCAEAFSEDFDREGCVLAAEAAARRPFAVAFAILRARAYAVSGQARMAVATKEACATQSTPTPERLNRYIAR